MKKYLLVIILIVSNIYSKGQQYYPFPDSNARWLEWTIWFENDHGFTYLLSGDTMINYVTYSKLYQAWGYFPPADNLGFFYIGGIREDSTHKVFYYPADNNPLSGCLVDHSTEIMLYDFNVEIGDTIKYYHYQWGSYEVIINHIILDRDSILISGSYRDRIKVFTDQSIDINYFSYWIEGIGSTYSLLAPVQFYGDGCYDHSELECFYQGGQFLPVLLRNTTRRFQCIV